MSKCLPLNNPEIRGFTLIELLVSTVIVTFLGAAIFVTFAQGIRVWQAAVRESEKGQSELFLETFESELRNAFVYKNASVAGERDSIQFYTFMPLVRTNNKERKVLKTIEKDITYYENILKEDKKAQITQTALEGITSMTFEYYQISSKESEAAWRRGWKSNCFPEAIKLVVERLDQTLPKMTKLFNMPSIGSCSSQEVV